MPLEQVIAERIAPAVHALGSSYIELQDHGDIHGVLVQVEVRPEVPTGHVASANEEIRTLLLQLALENPHKCMAAWSACFTRDGRTMASSWPTGIQGPEEA
jgi:hypothetical protein